LLLAQTTGLPPTQVPFWQLSVWVQALPSLQDVPLATATCPVQAPVTESQEPAVMHGLLVEQATGVPPMHAPL
jgi:hypothetical protein